ncbi:MAG TPA: periplasmic heavy metal sensor [Pyrinomonadaceae bacterium]|nr:periplasmic heavy metal sensor [Pyrinomonadaceae bacterium]
MNKFNLIGALFLAAFLAFSFSPVKAQDESAPEVSNRQPGGNRRPNLLAELNLSPEQIREIRRVNREDRFARRAAQQRLREANRNLDQAIYSDTVDEANIQLLVKELQAAQTEAIKFRTASELAVRKILTSQQLAKFREMRSQFQMQNRMRPNPRPKRPRNLPNRRLNNQPQKPPPNN